MGYEIDPIWDAITEKILKSLNATEVEEDFYSENAVEKLKFVSV